MVLAMEWVIRRDVSPGSIVLYFLLSAFSGFILVFLFDNGRISRDEILIFIAIFALFGVLLLLSVRLSGVLGMKYVVKIEGDLFLAGFLNSQGAFDVRVSIPLGAIVGIRCRRNGIFIDYFRYGLLPLRIRYALRVARDDLEGIRALGEIKDALISNIGRENVVVRC